MLEPKAIFPIFFAVWIVLGICGFLFFALEKDIEKKLRYFPRYIVGTSVLFGLVITLMVPLKAALLFLPFVALIAWMNLRMTLFCLGCGHMSVNHFWWRKMNFCPACGKKFDA